MVGLVLVPMEKEMSESDPKTKRLEGKQRTTMLDKICAQL